MVIKYRYEILGAHVHCQMFAGKDQDHLACAGNFVLRDAEFEQFRHVQNLGSDAAATPVLFELA